MVFSNSHLIFVSGGINLDKTKEQKKLSSLAKRPHKRVRQAMKPSKPIVTVYKQDKVEQ
jgi:hypothetical protein